MMRKTSNKKIPALKGFSLRNQQDADFTFHNRGPPTVRCLSRVCSRL